MGFSKYMPPHVYINMPDAVLNPRTEADKDLQNACMAVVAYLEMTPLSWNHVLAAVHVVLTTKKLAMPYGDTAMSSASKTQKAHINTARQDFVQSVLREITMDLSGAAVRYLVGDEDCTTAITAMHAPLPTEHRQTWIHGINAYLTTVLETQPTSRPIALITTDPRRLTSDKLLPVVGLLLPASEAGASDKGQLLRLSKKSDAVLYMSTDLASFAEQLRRVITSFEHLRERDAILRGDIGAGRIQLEQQFTRSTWPGYALMNNVKSQVRSLVHEAIEEQRVICDALDVEYQTLFRLTSLPIASVFEDGDALEAYLREQDAYGYWRNILKLDPLKVAQPIKHSVVKQIIAEQLVIVQDRMHNTTLPLDTLIHKQGIFSEPDWKLQKCAGQLAAIKVKPGTNGDEIVQSKRVTFKVVDTDYAKELHRVLHYIHGPRAIKAFGLYLEDDPVPFSVVAFDAIDRPYKRDLLLMYGYNPDKCLDLARLYSRPGTPFNTSSTIFTLAFSYFREHEPEVQAVLSAFMPTYAHGMSMISAGFNYGVMVKEWRHAFVERDIAGHKVWELLTKRRIAESHATIESQWPLLPVFELMATLQPPRFTPYPELEGMMVSRNL